MEGWTFVASKIKNSGVGRGLKTGTLAPLRLTFRANQPVYPMRLSAANPERFSIQVLLALAGTGVSTKGQEIVKVTHSPVNWSRGAYFVGSVAGGQQDYPTLGKLFPNGVRIFRHDVVVVRPNECTRDFVWNTTSERVAGMSTVPGARKSIRPARSARR